METKYKVMEEQVKEAKRLEKEALSKQSNKNSMSGSQHARQLLMKALQEESEVKKEE